MFSGGMEMEHWLEIGCGILNNFMYGILIFISSYPQAELLFNRVTVRCEWDLNPKILD